MTARKKKAPTRLAVEGELSIFTAADIRNRLLDACGAGLDVEVDLAKVTEVDSAGIQLLISAKREAAACDRAMRFCNHSAAVLDALDLCDIAGHLGDPLVIQSRH